MRPFASKPCCWGRNLAGVLFTELPDDKRPAWWQEAVPPCKGLARQGRNFCDTHETVMRKKIAAENEIPNSWNRPSDAREDISETKWGG